MPVTITIPIDITKAQKVWLKSMLTIAYGGAIGAVGQMFEAAVNLQKFTIELNKIDFHRVTETALLGAGLAIWNHFRRPPNVQPAAPVEPAK